MKKCFNTKALLSFLLGLFSMNVFAQQDPMFTHYMYNTLAVNPAYAGSRDALTVTALTRFQWVGFAGAPNTQTLTMHTPLKSEKLGLGLSFINDQIGGTNNASAIKTTSFFADFAYIIKTGEKSKLSFGLKGGGSLFQANLNALKIDNSSDPAFQGNTLSKFLPNFGFGLYYYMPRFYVGLSTPKLLTNTINSKTNAVVLNPEQRHYFFIVGAVFKLGDKLEFKPTSYVKATVGAPIEADVTGTFIIDKKLLLGLAYRTGDAMAGLAGYQITDQFLLSYSYDWSFGLQTGTYNSGSHELMLRYDFIYKNKSKIRSPRYF
jgi:type IX secretion system PorP/SprF family membrane protein